MPLSLRARIVLAVGISVISVGVLAWRDPGAGITLAGRLVPVFSFVIAMSVIVNISAQLGAFDWLALRIGARASGRPWALWLGVAALSVVSTVFLSLDTTAILLTPLAITLARQHRLPLVPMGLAVVWIANIASLPLPVSNLTNLLAAPSLGGSPEQFLALSWAPAITALIVVLIASAIAWARGLSRLSTSTPPPSSPLDTRAPTGGGALAALAGIAVLLPLLVSPIPVWLTSGVMAAVFVACAVWRAPETLSLRLIPWPSLLLATCMALAATATVSVLGTPHIGGGIPGLAAAGSLAANVMNNLPAYVALEPAATSPQTLMALLIGTNTGCIITPWGSLATLLWHEQLTRSGVTISWGRYMRWSAVLAPCVLIATCGALALRG